ncbi:DUF3083 family protein [Flocculibacter collagenilyticus]|uniref:DUF3083 family protein n=1 Tax=Flocculibacter collagenilyticus TaxID=2744479 RepID=UPI0018F78426|nr:DUF3083 family protein [Flocculibacter collagenilyticus]
MSHSSLKSSRIRRSYGQQKVYIPANHRENQYMSISLELTPAIQQQLNCVDTTAKSSSTAIEANTLINTTQILNTITRTFREVCEEYRLRNSLLIAKDKAVIVRYGEEPYIIETETQIFVFYDPKKHCQYKTIAKEAHLPKRITFVLLATGDTIRQRAAQFHQQVIACISALAEQLSIATTHFTFIDRQHITYDLFDAEKGNKETITHSFRQIAERYQHQGFLVPHNSQSERYIVATIPIQQQMIAMMQRYHQNEHVKNHQVVSKGKIGEIKDDVTKLQQVMENVVYNALEQTNLAQVAIVGNGHIPRIYKANKTTEAVINNNNVTRIEQVKDIALPQLQTYWQYNQLEDVIYLVFYGNEQDAHKKRYAKFVTKVHTALKQIAEELSFDKATHLMTVRFYQNLSYQLK